MAQSLLGQFARPHARDRARVLIDMPNSIPLPDGAAYGELNIPTLVVGAPGDPCHPFTLAQTLSTWIPKARFVEVPRKTWIRANTPTLSPVYELIRSGRFDASRVPLRHSWTTSP